MKSIRFTGDRIVTETDAGSVSVPAKDDTLIPHIARSMLEGDELEAFELLMGLGFGCSGVTIREKKK